MPVWVSAALAPWHIIVEHVWLHSLTSERPETQPQPTGEEHTLHIRSETPVRGTYLTTIFRPERRGPRG